MGYFYHSYCIGVGINQWSQNCNISYIYIENSVVMGNLPMGTAKTLLKVEYDVSQPYIMFHIMLIQQKATNEVTLLPFLISENKTYTCW